MNIKVIVYGKINEKFAREGIQEYVKRLSRYCKIKLVEAKNEVQVLKEISEKAYLIEIHTEGENISSEDLSTTISNLGIGGNSDITFIVSNFTLPPEVNNKVHFRMAISKMTMDLNILSITLCEQIYRAYRILTNEPYHK
jgi:23S rRNA (pseudouridine1915-N3)-methyltransferase